MSDKIKIIHVITTLGFGGAERLILDFMKKADHERFEYEVVSMVRGGELEEDFRRLGIPIKIFYKKGKLGLGVFLKLKQLFKEEKPDIVHTHLFGADVWAGLAAWLAGVPVILKTEHNLNISEGLFKKWLKKITAFIFKKMVAVSPAVVQYMVDVEHMPKDKIKIIFNGIDLKRFPEKENKYFSSPPVLINVSRFEEQKGHEYLIGALKKIKDTPWILWLVGDGTLRKDIQSMVERLEFADRVKFFGERKDVPNLLGQADIFVFPSLWEGLGLAVLEAGAVGLPIVATRVGGVADVFTDQQNASIVEAKNEEELARAISWMLEHPDKALYLGREAREMVHEKFSLESMVHEYEHLYKALLNE